MRLNVWPVGTFSNKDWSANVQDDQQNPQKRSLHPVKPRFTHATPCFSPVTPCYTPLLNLRYTLLHLDALLHTVTSMLLPRRGAASNFCVLVLLSSSSSPQNYGFYGPQIGSTCQVHWVKFPILISRTFQKTICSCWCGDPTVGVVLLIDIEAL